MSFSFQAQENELGASGGAVGIYNTRKTTLTKSRIKRFLILCYALPFCCVLRPWQALREENEAAMALSNFDDDSSVGTFNTGDTPTALDSARMSQHSARKSYVDVSEPEINVTPPPSASRQAEGLISPKGGIAMGTMPTPPSMGMKDIRMFTVSAARGFCFRRCVSACWWEGGSLESAARA